MRLATSFLLLLLSFEAPTVSAKALRTKTAHYGKVDKAAARDLAEDDKQFWERLLQGEGSMPPTRPPVRPPTSPPVRPPVPSPTLPANTPNPTNRPTKAPTPRPTTPPVPDPTPRPTTPPVPDPTRRPTPSPTSPPVVAPTPPLTSAPVPMTAAPVPMTAAPVTSAPVAAPVTAAPAPDCPTLLEVACALPGGADCMTAVPPESGSGATCVVQATYTYTLVNDSDDQERIYGLQVDYGLTGTNFIPVGDFQSSEVLLAPGASTTVSDTQDVNICAASGTNALALSATLFTGPPIAVDIQITCVDETGRECGAITVITPAEECALDIIYTYTVTNTGLADTVFQSFSRTRNGETVDLLPLVGDPTLPIGASRTFEETETIDSCVAQDFSTTTSVAQAPSPDYLCSDTVRYP